MLIRIILIAALLCSIVLPFGTYLLSQKRKKHTFKTALAFNIFSFFGIMLIATVLLFSGKVAAADTVATEASVSGLKYIAAALATGMSTIGAGIAVASSASAALGALSENPEIMGKALIFVALAEGVALYGLLISFMILN